MKTTTCVSFNHFQFLWLITQHCVTENGIHTLVNVVVANPMRAYLFPQSCTTQKFPTFDVTLTKERRYYNRHLVINQFLLLAIKIFGCLCKHVNVFLHECANAIWSLKKPKGPPLSVLSWLLFFIKEFQLRCKECKHPPSKVRQ